MSQEQPRGQRDSDPATAEDRTTLEPESLTPETVPPEPAAPFGTLAGGANPAPQRRYFHRELSWLRFNLRVLEEARDERLPAMERAKFLAIVSTNLDEFVMVRLAALVDNQRQRGTDPSGLTYPEQLRRVRDAVSGQMKEQYDAYHALLLELERYNLKIINAGEWTELEKQIVSSYFRQSLELTVTPLAVGPSHPFPQVGNLQRFLALELRPEEGGPTRYALVGIPARERRLLRLGGGRFALVDEVLRSSVEQLFPGFEVVSDGIFRVTRDGSIDIDEDQTRDLMSEIEQGLRLRGRGLPMRMEVEAGMPQQLVKWLTTELELPGEAVVDVSGPLDLTFLFRLAELSEELAQQQFSTYVPAACPVDWSDPFATLREQSLFLHHPYDSFRPVTELVQKAAADPEVVAIKQTLYRVSGDSPIVQALIDAAEQGKQITVLCELKARFDEERNILWAKRLEEAGAHVLYGVIGYKVHAKLLLVVRRDEDGIRRYAHLGTGNYNDRTAAVYEDFSYFTSNEAVCRDVARLFNMLTGFSRPPTWERLVVAPLNFRSTMQDRIQREALHARSGRQGRVFAKFNSLVDTELCEHLYAASQAGVQIDLVVRGVCILRPGIQGLSENIRVRSVVGRFLEHSRFYYFANAGDPEYMIGSGDWMTRNLDRRVEELVQIREADFRGYLDRLMQDYLQDKRSTRVLQADGHYEHLGKKTAEPGIQERLMHERTTNPQHRLSIRHGEFRPVRKPGPWAS